MDKQYPYFFQNINTRENFEVMASNSTEAFYKCRIEKKWPLDKTRYLGKHLIPSKETHEKMGTPVNPVTR
jgi:hypothetical protein